MAVDLDAIIEEARREKTGASKSPTAPQSPRSLIDEVLDELRPPQRTLSDLIAPKPAPAKEPSPFSRPVSTFVRPLLEGTGMIGGGMMGAASPIPGGAFIGGTLGYAGMGGLADVLETAAGERNAPTSIGDALQRTGSLLEEGGLAEAGGRLLGKTAEVIKQGGKSLIRAIASGQAKAITPEQQLIVETAQEMGIQLRPSEVTGSDVGAQIEQNARRSMFGRGKFQRLDEKNSANLIEFYDTFAEKTFGQQQSPQELGRLVQQAVTGQVVPDVAAVNRGLYQTLQQQTGDAAIVSSETVLPRARSLTAAFDLTAFPKSNAIAAKVEELVSQRGPSTGLTVTKEMAPDIPASPGVTTVHTPEPGSTPLKGPGWFTLGGRQVTTAGPPTPGPMLSQLIVEKSETERLPKALTFMQAHDARSMLLDLTRTGEVLSSREKHVASNLADALDTAMETAAKKFDALHGTTVLEDWRIANASMRASHELFDSAVIRKAVSATPEDVVKVAFNRNAITETDRVFAALKTSPGGTNAYRQGAFKELLARSHQDDVHQIINPQRMYDAAYGRTGVGDVVMQKTFGEAAPALKRFITAAARMNVVTVYSNVHPGQTNTSLVNWFEQGMILSAPIASATAAAAGHAGTAIAPVATVGLYAISIDQLARLVNKPSGLRLLTAAAGLKPTTKDGIRIGGLLLKELATSPEESQGHP